MTRFKIIHNTANKELVQDGLTPIDKIFCVEECYINDYVGLGFTY